MIKLGITVKDAKDRANCRSLVKLWSPIILEAKFSVRYSCNGNQALRSAIT